MRLINARTRRYAEFFDNELPPYAILSHTWTREELSYQEYSTSPPSKCKNQPGYRKIDLCCKQAIGNGLSYVWVDTVCIDKSSSAELSEAVNSMFRWYQKAVVCYAFLSDVDHCRYPLADCEPVHGADEYDEKSTSENKSFIQSRWFTRGWTLQELLAPRRVVFFDAGWNHIGTRDSLASLIANVTGIEVYILANPHKVSTCSVAQRFSWASKRTTTRKEDMAYSLLGIFEVNIPIFYGEGMAAFRRLQEEIIRTSVDLSLLTWNPISGRDRTKVFAPSPANFAGCGNVVSYRDHEHAMRRQRMSSVNTGLMLYNTAVVRVEYSGTGPTYVALLCCRYHEDVTTTIGLRLNLRTADPDEYMSANPDTIDCEAAWCSVTNLPPTRLLSLDALEVRKTSTIRNIHLADYADHRVDWNSLDMAFSKHQVSHIWLRFADQSVGDSWSTEDVVPQQYWTASNRTFNFRNAREGTTPSDKSIVSLRMGRYSGGNHHQVRGGIALSHTCGRAVAIYFLLDGFDPLTGLSIDIEPYDPKTFSFLDRVFGDPGPKPSWSLDLEDLKFTIELGLENISSMTMAVLHASVQHRCK